MTTTVLLTKREYLASITGPDGKPLAIAGSRGRFSQAAMAALAEAEKSGMEFAVPVVATPAVKTEKKVVMNKPVSVIKTEKKSEAEYDAKEVRAWATQVGMKVGDRGRIHSDVVNAYLAATGGTPKKKPAQINSINVQRAKVRPETVAYGYARRKPEDGKHITEPLIQIKKCGACSSGIAYCNCSGGPKTPNWMGKETALLHKPV